MIDIEALINIDQLLTLKLDFAHQEIQIMIAEPHPLQKRFLAIFLLIFCAAPVAARAQNADDGLRDTQLWPDVNFMFRVRPDFAIVIFGTVRTGRDARALISEQVGAGVMKALRKGHTISTAYRFVNSEPTPGRLSREHRIFVDLTPRTPLKWGILLSDRNRIEWRSVNHAVSWRYRNRVQFERPLSIDDHRIIPYVSAETYYDTRFRTLNRNQIFLGARIPLSRHAAFDGFYMRQFDARVRPGFLHVMGVFWRFEY